MKRNEKCVASHNPPRLPRCTRSRLYCAGGCGQLDPSTGTTSSRAAPSRPGTTMTVSRVAGGLGPPGGSALAASRRYGSCVALAAVCTGTGRGCWTERGLCTTLGVWLEGRGGGLS